MKKANEFYFPLDYISRNSGINKNVLSSYVAIGDPLFLQQDEGFPIFGLISLLQKLLDNPVSQANPANDDNSLRRQKISQEILKLLLQNILVMKLVILKETAEQRMIETLTSVRSAIEQGIVRATQELAYLGESRDIETAITNSISDALEKLYNSSSKIEWEDDEDAESLKVKLNSFVKNNQELSTLVDQIYDDTRHLNE